MGAGVTETWIRLSTLEPVVSGPGLQGAGSVVGDRMDTSLWDGFEQHAVLGLEWSPFKEAEADLLLALCRLT